MPNPEKNETTEQMIARKANGETVNLKANMSSMIGEVQYNGKTHLSIPAVMMTAGVRNKVLYSEEVLSKFPQTWNGMAVTVDHPMKNNGITDANQPDVLEEWRVGQMFDCKWEDGKLKGLAYVDPEVLGKKKPAILDKIRANGMVEVSTGLFSDDELTPGEWNGEAYDVVAKTVYPNHFALLSTGIGACSIAEGAGAPRINKQEKRTMIEEAKALFKSLAEKLNFRVNELSHGDTWTRLTTAIRAEVGDTLDNSAWVQEVFDNHFIYEVSKTGETVKLYKRGYAVDQKDEVSLLDDKEEVVLKTEYVPAPKINQEQKPEGVTQEMETKVETKVETPVIPTPATPKVLTEQEIDAKIQSGIVAGIKANRKSETITRIKANEKNKLPDSALNAMSEDELTAYAKEIIPADFGALSGGSLKANETESDVPEVPPCLLAVSK